MEFTIENECVRQAIESLVNEIGDVQPLTEAQTKLVRELACITWENEPMFYGLTNLVVTHPEDFAAVKNIQGLEFTTRLDIISHNIHLYVFQYHNNKHLLESLVHAST